MNPMHGKVAGLAALLAITLIAGCTSMRAREGEPTERERYWYYAGEPVSSFQYFGRVSGWSGLSRNELVVFTGVNNAYLLTTDGTCFDLPTAFTIGLESRMGSSISNFDSVRVGRDRCRITEIRPIDYKRMKQEARELREERKAAAPAG